MTIAAARRLSSASRRHPQWASSLEIHYYSLATALSASKKDYYHDDFEAIYDERLAQIQ
jgi:hypothetical protein